MCPGVAAVRDLYAVLNLKPDANLNEVRAAYRRAALITHPDKGGTAQAFHIVKFAFEVLSCSTSRQVYDSTYIHNAQTQGTAVSARKPRNPLKRGAAHSWFRPSQSKRQKRCDPSPALTKQKEVAATHAALERLRTLLQSMAPSERSATLQMVDPQVSNLLYNFMKKHQLKKRQAAADSLTAKKNTVHGNQSRRVHLCGSSLVNSLRNDAGTRYRTQLVIRGLRLYTLARCYEDAIEHHITLVHVRDAIATADRADSSLWSNPAKLIALFKAALIERGASERSLNLHTFIYLKAAPWLHVSTTITSPVLPFSDAVLRYTRLLSAQSTSWEEFRSEWVALLLIKRKCQGKGRHVTCQEQAEAIADTARHFALVKQLKRAELGVKVAVRNEKARAAALKREAIRQQRAKLRLRWHTQKNLTMEEMMGRRQESV